MCKKLPNPGHTSVPSLPCTVLFVFSWPACPLYILLDCDFFWFFFSSTRQVFQVNYKYLEGNINYIMFIYIKTPLTGIIYMLCIYVYSIISTLFGFSHCGMMWRDRFTMSGGSLNRASNLISDKSRHQVCMCVCLMWVE